jgi:hypothetical protein
MLDLGGRTCERVDDFFCFDVAFTTKYATGNGTSLTTNGFQFSTSLSASNPPFNAVELTYPGVGSPVGLTRVPNPFPSPTSIYAYSSSLS